MKKCVKCNFNLEDKAVFCPNCGTSQNKKQPDVSESDTGAIAPETNKDVSESIAAANAQGTNKFAEAVTLPKIIPETKKQTGKTKKTLRSIGNKITDIKEQSCTNSHIGIP